MVTLSWKSIQKIEVYVEHNNKTRFVHKLILPPRVYPWRLKLLTGILILSPPSKWIPRSRLFSLTSGSGRGRPRPRSQNRSSSRWRLNAFQSLTSLENFRLWRYLNGMAMFRPTFLRVTRPTFFWRFDFMTTSTTSFFSPSSSSSKGNYHSNTLSTMATHLPLFYYP